MSGGVSGGRRSLSNDPSAAPLYWNGTDTAANDRAHVFHSWSAQALINPVAIAGGEGSWIWDFDGNRYLDFSSQLMNVNLGHGHPTLVAAIQEAAGRLATIGPFHANADRSEAARLIADVAPDGMNKVFFTNGGADANENAIRMARLHTGRHKVLAAHRSYHGATAGAITMTGDPRRWASEPSMPGVVRFFGPYPYRSSFHSESPEQECERALAHLDELVMFEGAHNVAAIIIEPVVGTNGILVPPDGYLVGMRELCDRHGIMMISDEVMAGFGRCGEWFAIQRWDVTPDLICFAKGVNSGYVPLGGVIMSDAIAATFDERVYPGGLTYSGHPLACASAVASIGVFREEGTLHAARTLGDDVIGPELEAMAERHPSVGEVRGLGAFWAIELVRDRATREMYVPYNAAGDAAKPMNDVVAAIKELGVWVFAHFNRIHITPPCNTSHDDVRNGLAAIDKALEVADAHIA
nr:aspartate aminotransferase family protein [Candidatus Microthrix sp.]